MTLVVAYYDLLCNACSTILLCVLVGWIVWLMVHLADSNSGHVRERTLPQPVDDHGHDHQVGNTKKLLKSALSGDRLRKFGTKKIKKKVKFAEFVGKQYELRSTNEILTDKCGETGEVGDEVVDLRQEGEKVVRECITVGDHDQERVEQEMVSSCSQGEEKSDHAKEDEELLTDVGNSSEGEVKDGEGMLSDEEEWEGIERSELEERFGLARAVVEKEVKEGRLGKVDGSDVVMELYGLEKVVLEGPCREPPPMALKVAAWAKWNAWQTMGNMDPEEAMEKYINLVKVHVPDWMKDHSSIEKDPTTAEVGHCR